VVILMMSIIASLVSAVAALVVAAVNLAVATPVVAVVATVVVTPVVAAVVAVIITSIPVVIAMIGPAITVTTSIRSTVTVVEALVTVLVVVVVTLGLLGLRRYSEGRLQLLALPHGMFGIAVELALVVHDHVEVTFEEGGRSWWICHVGFARSLTRPVSTILVIFVIEVVHHRILSGD
jgi:hypothetical protein